MYTLFLSIVNEIFIKFNVYTFFKQSLLSFINNAVRVVTYHNDFIRTSVTHLDLYLAVKYAIGICFILISFSLSSLSNWHLFHSSIS